MAEAQKLNQKHASYLETLVQSGTLLFPGLSWGQSKLHGWDQSQKVWKFFPVIVGDYHKVT